ncbi:MAG TPA: hypothetical protein VFQ91_23120 [Bryobacteraceae bacterium]|nr:hypothetical protein [Bryobacteraceae bacterium]
MKWLCCLALTVGMLPAQPRTFDQYTYEAPAGYTPKEHRDAVEWSKIDQKRRFYCQIGLYRAQKSLGSTAQDLENEWQAVVVRQFKVQGTSHSRELPLPQAPASIMRGAETIDGNGNKTISSLFVLRFEGRYAAVLFNAPNAEAFQACQEDITRVVGSLQMAAPQSTPAAAPLQGSITGTWERVVASRPAMNYNPIARTYEYSPAAAMMQFRQVHRYQFNGNGQYTYELVADDYNRAQRSRIVETGAYNVANGVIQFQPKEYRDGTGPKNQEPPLAVKAVPPARARRFLLGEHPQYKDSAGLQLQTADGAFETFKPVR